MKESFIPADASPRVRAMLLQRGTTKRTGEPPSREEIARALEARGLPAHPPVIDAYHRFGGLTWPIKQLPTGAYEIAELPDLAAQEEQDRYVTDAGEVLIHVGTVRPDVSLHMGPDGAIVDVTAFKEEGELDEERLLPYATSMPMLLEQSAMLLEAEDMSSRRLQISLRGTPRGVFGELLSRALHAEHIPEASDALRRWWKAPGLLILEGHIPRSMLDEVTTVYVDAVEAAAAVLLALKDAGAPARVTISARRCTRLPADESIDESRVPTAELEYADWRSGIDGHVRLYGAAGGHFIEQVFGGSSRRTWQRFTNDECHERVWLWGALTS